MKRRSTHGHPRAVFDFWFSEDDWDQVCARHDAKKYWFDPDAAARVLNFLTSCCTHVEGEWAGRPLMPEQWEFRLLRDLFGWKRLSDGTRKYRTAYIEVPRKNGKSTLGAGVGLYLTLADREPGAKVFSAATDRDQAAIIFEIAAQMVRQNPELSERCQVFKRSIYSPAGNASYRVLSGAPTKSGLNASGIIFDELHEQPNRKLWDVLHTSTVARRQPVSWISTTAGFDETTICWELHERAKKVASGVYDDPSLLPVIYAADEKDDWTDEKIWAKANPNIGISVKVEYLRTECEVAQQVPAYQNTFKRLHLDIWTRQMELWMPKNKWDACNEPFPVEVLDGQTCFGGLDLASVDDLAAFAKVWPVLDPEAGVFHFFSALRFWMPGANLREKEDQHLVPYSLWAEQGWVQLTEGNIIDFDVIRRDINADGERYPIKEIAIDRWNSTQITTQLAGDGFTVVPFGQGFGSMAGPTRQLMNIVLARTLHHGANPVLDWMASNVAVAQDAAGNWKPDKKASKKKIDGVVALIMALGRASLGLDSGESVYDSRGVLTL